MPDVRGSAHIDKIEYDNGVLKVTYDHARAKEKTYTFEGVPHSLYERLMEAPSKGAFFHKWIKPRFKGKVQGEEKNAAV